MSKNGGSGLWIVLALIIGVIVGFLGVRVVDPMLSVLNKSNVSVIAAFSDPGQEIIIMSADGYPIKPFCSEKGEVPCDAELKRKLQTDYTTVLQSGERSQNIYEGKPSQTSSNVTMPSIIETANAQAANKPCERYFSLHGGKVIVMYPDPCTP